MKRTTILIIVMLLSIATASAELVLDLSFDSDTDCGNDDTGRHADFTASGTASCIDDTSICQWFGCGNFSTDGGDYFSGTTNFTLTDELTVMFWLNTDQDPGSPSQAYYEIGDDSTDDYLYAEEGDYGMNARWKAATGQVGNSAGESDGTISGIWSHYAMTYDGATYTVYKNGVNVGQESQSYGNLNYTDSSLIRVGRAIYGIDLIGLMDEFQIYNESLSQETILGIYNEQVGGTPPDYDIVITNITRSGDNLLYTIKSRGLFNISTTFSNRFYINGSIACTNTTTGGLDTGDTVTYSCAVPSWDTGVHTIRVVLDYLDDVSEDDGETNNAISFPYNTQPFPRLHPPLDMDWINANTDSPSYDAYINIRNFAAEDFNAGWTADNSDPRMKKGWENAISCYLTDYVSTSGNDECGRAINHLEGWLNGTISAQDYADATVQSTHELASLALTYDLMYNNLTQPQRDLYATKMVDICTAVYKSSSISLYNDEEVLFPGNGKGFGSGFTYPCWEVNGLVDSNPGILAIPPGGLSQYSIVDGYVDRLKWYLQGNQGDRSAEGILYANYGLYHTIFILQALKDADYADISSTDTDGVLKGLVNYILDFNTLGSSIGDRAQYTKFYSFGDTHPYDEIGEINQIGAGIYTALGTYSDNSTIKNLAYTARNIIREKDSAIQAHNAPTADIWFYPVLAQEATNLTTQEIQTAMGNGYLGPTWDYLYLRNNRTFVDDTVVIIDGGDKPAWGHPQAEFDLYVYAMGENWLDYGAVPYEDDIRSEYWHNTISLQDDDSSYYWSDGYSAPLNQPYGGAISAWRTDYPNAEFMPGYSRGVINDSFILEESEGFGGGMRMFQRYLYNTSQPIERRTILYEDFIVDAFIVNRTPEGFASMSFLNYLELYPGSTDGTDLTYTRGSKTYEIRVLHSTTPLTLEGGDTGVSAGDEKTSYGGLNVTYQRYEYTTDTADNEIFVFLHHWYDGTSESYDIIDSGGQYGVSVDGVNATLLLDSEDWYYISSQGTAPPEEPDPDPDPVVTTSDAYRCSERTETIMPPLLIISVIVGLLLLLGVVDMMIAALIITPIVMTIATACL